MTNRENKKISEILSNLTQDSGLSVSQVAKKTGLPAPTIYRIVNNKVSKPHYNSLKAIANFFNISVNQLKGVTPILKTPQWPSIPSFPWEKIEQWFGDKSDIDTSLIPSAIETSQNAFAVIISDQFIRSGFSKDSILIFDTLERKNINDGDFVLVKLEKHEKIQLRKVATDLDSFFVKSPDPSFDAHAIKLESKDKILATLIQTIKLYR